MISFKALNLLFVTACALIILLAFTSYREPDIPSFSRVLATPRTEFTHDIPLEKLEEALRELKFSPAHELLLDENSEQALKRLVARLPDSSRHNVLSRLAFLIHRGWQAQEAEQLIRLTTRYLQFVSAESEQMNAAVFNDELERLQWLKSLRRVHFSEAEAAVMFGAQEMLSEYLLRRQKLQQDQALSEGERRAALLALDQSMQEPEQP